MYFVRKQRMNLSVSEYIRCAALKFTSKLYKMMKIYIFLHGLRQLRIKGTTTTLI